MAHGCSAPPPRPTRPPAASCAPTGAAAAVPASAESGPSALRMQNKGAWFWAAGCSCGPLRYQTPRAVRSTAACLGRCELRPRNRLACTSHPAYLTPAAAPHRCEAPVGPLVGASFEPGACLLSNPLTSDNATTARWSYRQPGVAWVAGRWSSGPSPEISESAAEATGAAGQALVGAAEPRAGDLGRPLTSSLCLPSHRGFGGPLQPRRRLFLQGHRQRHSAGVACHARTRRWATSRPWLPPLPQSSSRPQPPHPRTRLFPCPAAADAAAQWQRGVHAQGGAGAAGSVHGSDCVG